MFFKKKLYSSVTQENVKHSSINMHCKYRNFHPSSPHLYGKAVDIVISGKSAYRLMKLAIQHGFTGIGVSQRGPHEKRFLHIDTMENSDTHPRPWIWSYK